MSSTSQWGVDFGGATQASTGASVSDFYAQNGTYNYTITPPINYTAKNLSGTASLRIAFFDPGLVARMVMHISCTLALHVIIRLRFSFK